MAPPARNTGSRPPRHRPGLPPKRSRPRRRARRSLFVAVVVAGAAPAAVLLSQGPAALPLTPLQARIVRIANSQLGQRTSPSDSYCNRYSAFWGAGDPTGCPAGLTAEEWCADFAAWVWRKAGAVVTYGTGSGEIDAASVSFYEWGVATRRWHPAGSAYVPRAGDVAVYGLNLTTGAAQHVAVVTSYTPGSRGPDVVNGDGSRTGFSVVEVGQDQWKADIHGNGGQLAGYVSPSPPPPRVTSQRT